MEHLKEFEDLDDITKGIFDLETYLGVGCIFGSNSDSEQSIKKFIRDFVKHLRMKFPETPFTIINKKVDKIGAGSNDAVGYHWQIKCGAPIQDGELRAAFDPEATDVPEGYKSYHVQLMVLSGGEHSEIGLKWEKGTNRFYYYR